VRKTLISLLLLMKKERLKWKCNALTKNVKLRKKRRRKSKDFVTFKNVLLIDNLKLMLLDRSAPSRRTNVANVPKRRLLKKRV